MFSQNRTITKLGAPDRIYTEEDGLISNSCYGLTQDLDGFIWIYSENGISKFDGHTFKNFTTADGLNSNNVWMISVDSMNRKWIHTDEKRLDYILDDKIYEGVVIPNRRLTLLVSVNKHTSISIEQSNRLNFEIQDTFLNQIFLPKIKILQESGQPYFLNNFTVRLYSVADSAIITNRRTKYTWLLGTNGEFRTPSFINGQLQLSRQEGLDVFRNNNSCTSFELDKKIQINRGMSDINDNIWIASKQNGIYYYSIGSLNNSKSVLTHNLNLSGRIKFDYQFAYTNYKDDIFEYNPKKKEFKKILSAVNTKFLTKTQKFLILFKYTVGSVFDYPLLSNHKLLTTFFRSNNQNIEVFDAVNFSENKFLVLESSANSLNLIETNKDKWHNNIIYQWESRPHWIEIDSVTMKTIVCCKNSIFVFDSNLNLFDSIPILIQDYNHEFKHHYVDYKNQEIYLSSNDIIYRITKQFTEKIHEFKNISGMKMIDHYLITFNDNCCNIFDMKSCSNLAVSCEDTKDNVQENKIIDAFYISDSLMILKSNGIETFHIPDQSKSSKHILLHNPNYEFWFTNNFDSIYISTEDSIKTLELSCSILDPSLSNQTGYKFKLANSDNWQVSEVNRIYLGELPEGHHQVKIIAYDKITSQELASKTIHCFVSTPWYKSKYFKFFILLLIIGLAIHVTRYFLTRRYKSLIALNEAVLENRSLKLKALEAQMNPHLIYNSLGGIQSLVQTQNYNKAEHYIIKFSKLLRMLLDSLRKNEVSLDKELELLSAYLEIEKFRFNDRFKYNLYTDPKLEKESIYIPNMLIQPFVENALNHGLFHRIEGGLLNINIQKSKSDLVVEIVDNGIGVKQAKEKYKTSRLGHESHALNIIQEKIELFKNLKNFHIVISTQDLDPTNKDYPGTHVTFTFKNILENE